VLFPPRLQQNNSFCYGVRQLLYSLLYSHHAFLCSVQTRYTLGQRTRSFAVGLSKLALDQHILLPHFMAAKHNYICYRDASWHEMQIVYSHIVIMTCLKFSRDEGHIADKMFGYDIILLLLARHSAARMQLQTCSTQWNIFLNFQLTFPF
jgi:hypothetical protein